MKAGTVTVYWNGGTLMTTWACPHCGRLFDLFELCMNHARKCDARKDRAR